MSQQNNIAIVIPALNEEKRIAATIQSIRSGGDYFIIVVDDGSTDATAAAARGADIVLRHKVNRGMGAALVTGTRYALDHGASIIVHFDADGQHAAGEISRVVAPLQRDDCDIVLGSRYLQKNKLPFTKRYFIHAPALLLQRLTTGLRLSDVHNGFRAMTRQAAQKIQITQDRMAHASEIINEIARLQLRYQEVPITVTYHTYGQGFRGGVRIMYDLIIKRLSP